MQPKAEDRPSILLIDNESSERVVGIREALRGEAEVRALDPQDVEPEDIFSSDLVSVDEYLGAEWADFVSSESRALPASVRNRDGLAVAAAIRSQVRGTGTVRPLAVTLHTGELAKLGGSLPLAQRESLVAAQHDLEWVFQFDAPNFATRLLEVARAARSLRDGSRVVSHDFGARWLDVPDAPWAETARAQLEDARPPAHSLADDTDGRSYLRWLAHRVLPYPSFLVSAAHAANLLGVEQSAFPPLEPIISRYKGPLAQLLGPRWWRASIQQLLVDEDLDAWDPAQDRAAALSAIAETELRPLTHAQAVVAYTADGEVDNIDTDPLVSVRLQLDGWPVWADDPWATLETVRHDERLRRTISRADATRLQAPL